jgi:putative hemolysin
MEMKLTYEISIILGLILLNGVLAMSEIALVSSRKVRLQEAARKGSKGAQVALNLSLKPTRFLSTVQVGITFVSIFSGAYGGATIAAELSKIFQTFSPLAAYGDALGITIVVVSIALVSLILGELVPKRIALSNPEGISAYVATPMKVLSTITFPIVYFLSAITELVLKILRIRNIEKPEITEDELKAMIDLTHSVGEISGSEKDYIKNIFEFTDTRCEEIMVPRTEIDAINQEATINEALEYIGKSSHTRVPVYNETLDNIIGIATVKEMLKLSQRRKAGRTKLKNLKLIKPVFVPTSAPIALLFKEFQKKHVHMAIIVDEFGGTAGLVTMEDVLEEIVGDIVDESDREVSGIKKITERTYILDADVTIEELKDYGLPIQIKVEDHKTLSYYILNKLGRFPKVGEKIKSGKSRMIIEKMDENTIEKVKLILPHIPSKD